MDIFNSLALGFKVALSPMNLFYCFIGSVLGTAVGVLPGLGCAATIALLLPLTFYLNDVGALIMLAGIYYGAMYGGSTTSILFRIPGESTSVVTCLDGYAMAKNGRAGAALGISAFGSFIAGTLAIIGLTFFAPGVAEWALEFGPPEYFSLMVLGMTLVTFLGRGSAVKTIMMAILGMLLGTVGLDPVNSVARFTFGSTFLMSGLELVLLAMGMFGIVEVLKMIERPVQQEQVVKAPKDFLSLLPNLQEWKDSSFPILRGTVLGFLVGVLPGGGAIISTFASYGIEKRISKHPERFGEGAIEGVAGPESANNAASTGAFIPLLTLGIPSNGAIALLLGAIMIHGITPGPLLFKNRPDMFWGLVASMYIGNVMLIVLNLPLVGLFAKIAYLPTSIINPIIAFICILGAYGVNNNSMDILIMIFFGVLGYFLEKLDFEPAPLLLAFILGPMIEIALRQSLILSRGTGFAIFFSRPISAITLSVAIILYFSPLVTKIIKGHVTRRRGRITF
ncbi:MAG TPA: transporter [Syntrophus sp. (in: bacteria)]|nr:transporter [Syntrophus sp. (in: bacteria)]